MLLIAARVEARPRVQVAPFVVHDGALAYFGPEVARAIAAALEGAGVETGAGGELAVNGRIELVGDEHVRLTASLRGKTLAAEGPLEAVDDVAAQLANKMAPLLLENDPAAQKAAERRAHEAERRAAQVPTHKERLVVAETTTVTVPRGAVKAESKPESAKPAKIESAKPEPDATPVAASADPTKPEPTRPPDKPDKPDKTDKPESAKPEVWTPPRVDAPSRPESEPSPPPPPPLPPPSPFGGFVRGRIVAHAIPDAATAYPGAGVMATQALFNFLHRRMRLSVVPTGVGLSSTAVATDEAYRAGARAAVMARLESVEYFAGPTARVRLEVVVIRDGRPVMRRVVESVPTGPVDQSRRGPGADALFQAVTAALEALVPELVGALADVR
jgi:hypothetical protein